MLLDPELLTRNDLILLGQPQPQQLPNYSPLGGIWSELENGNNNNNEDAGTFADAPIDLGRGELEGSELPEVL